MKRSPLPTAPTTALPLRCGRAIFRARTAWRRASTSGSSGSIAGCCATCARRSAASSIPGWAAKAAWTRCGFSRNRRTSAWRGKSLASSLEVAPSALQRVKGKYRESEPSLYHSPFTGGVAADLPASIMTSPKNLLESNRRWSEAIRAEDPGFFERLSKQQAPQYLWIGCSDSRVPANEILGIDPGEVFVHRNMSNLGLHSDMNFLSVMQFALKGDRLGLLDNWLRYIGDTLERHQAEIDALPEGRRPDRLCELNVIEQVANACHTTIVRDAWDRGQALTVHGWCYGLSDGCIHDLGMKVGQFEKLESAYANALSGLTATPA